ncbi:Tol-Pal system beta propeller repeat protein TolB [Sphingomicrobium aestuariivivum]|uniref:Tol-Pal system beta propeller repeat protein TolB n=1 Tax=Sphingomicrobium aestuariivivum TaxID=1582356 RepID=UPI001FD70F01|nr:Tol-Pal system beta propeller repeat protein TolB [Sphingomicrobium aestuariivivum]MCJ8191459.1 Tol-Pal system beta propeller repeat protein TolB [Sphingomicrobium aestuariivivum]
MFRKALLLLSLVLPGVAHAQDDDRIQVDVVGGQQAAQPVAVPQMAARGPATTPIGNVDTVSNNVSIVIASDLRSTGVITPIGPVGIRRLRNGEVTDPIFSDWQRAGASALVSGYVELTPNGRLTLACYLFDTVTGRELVRQGYSVDPNDWRRAAHKCADTVYSRLSGEEPFLDTRIVYVAETGPKGNRVKRIALMDSDGQNHRYLTEGQETVLTPRFSPRGDQLVYMSYKGRRPRSYVYDLASGQSRLLVPGTAFTFAPSYSPDGRNIVFSMASGGNTDIYVVSANGGTPRRLTTMPGVDTSPSFSPDGRRIVFESDRSGSQQLYVMNADGSDQRRISFGGGQYASPTWSPLGNLIAFTKIGGGQFRIGVMAPTGGGERLLTSAWQDEGPSWAPNGQFVMFHRTTQGSGDATLYAVPVNGGRARVMPTPLGGSDPSWSPLQN